MLARCFVPIFYFGLHGWHFWSIISSPWGAPVIARCTHQCMCMHVHTRTDGGEDRCTFIFEFCVYSTVLYYIKYMTRYIIYAMDESFAISCLMCILLLMLIFVRCITTLLSCITPDYIHRTHDMSCKAL